ncbi:MAG TPA: prepilin-type N-terminal cleavage/methylation domain-containing protein [Woeseiaceae bacterium]|nr:prepilin-type N-terminal cleavage/methylation domain-containing protein [Woeseiaceae bacterium]
MIRVRKQRGFSLVELMIGLTIGLFLLAGLMSIFTQSRRTYAYQQAQAGQQSNERLGVAVLTTELQQAGFGQMTDIYILNRAGQYPNSALFGAGEAVAGTQGSANVTVNGIAGPQTYPSDTLAVRYWDGPGIVDCVGIPVPPATLSQDVIATDGVNLTCSTNGGPARPLMGDDQGPVAQQLRVLGMAIAYGLDTNGDESVDTYQRAGGILNWNQVRVAEVELTIQAGSRPPETLSFAVTLENMHGAI